MIVAAGYSDTMVANCHGTILSSYNDIMVANCKYSSGIQPTIVIYGSYHLIYQRVNNDNDPREIHYSDTKVYTVTDNFEEVYNDTI